MTKQNEAQFRRVYEEGMNQGNLDVAEETISSDYHDNESHGEDGGPESLRNLITMLRSAFPDLYFEIEDLISDGDLVAGRLMMNGTHKGPLMGIPPTGRPVHQSQMHFVRFRDGKAVEHWGIRDDMGMMHQLGLAPQRS